MPFEYWTAQPNHLNTGLWTPSSLDCSIWHSFCSLFLQSSMFRPYKFDCRKMSKKNARYYSQDYSPSCFLLYWSSFRLISLVHRTQPIDRPFEIRNSKCLFFRSQCSSTFEDSSKIFRNLNYLALKCSNFEWRLKLQ